MTTKQVYQDRKQADLKELDTKVSELETAARGTGAETTKLLETLRNRYQDAQNAYDRLATGGDDWEELMVPVDAAFRNVYVALARAKEHIG